MVCEGGYSVMTDDNSFLFDPYSVTEWELEELKKDWQEWCN